MEFPFKAVAAAFWSVRSGADTIEESLVKLKKITGAQRRTILFTKYINLVLDRQMEPEEAAIRLFNRLLTQTTLFGEGA
jgi:hypothetical protein